MADEVELKLQLSAAGAERIAASEFFDAGMAAAEQVSTYFDTSDGRVAQAGFSLRIRTSQGQRIQTIKADGASAAGLFMRSEWEQPVDDDAPVLDHSTPLRAILGDAVKNVRPVFAARIDRRTARVEEDETAIEMVLDRGEITAGGRSETVCEVELELKLGDPAALFGLARKIDAVAPVRLGVLSKSERGCRLTEADPTSVGAEPLMLALDVSASDAFRRIVQSCIRQFRLNEDLLLETRHPDALHQARVAIRRMRSAFAIFKPMIGDDGAGLRDELKWLASELAEAHDLDVLKERVVDGPLHGRIAAAREAACDRVIETLASHRARVIMLNVSHWLAQTRWTDGDGEVGRMPARAFASAALARLRRRIRRRGEGLASLDDAPRHEVRKDVKKLRYASEFFTSLFGRKREQRRHKRFVAALQVLQDRLGALNDMASGLIILRRIGIGEKADIGALLGDAPSRAKLLARAEAAWDDLFDTRKFW